MISLSQRLRELRTQKGISAIALSAELNLPRAAIDRYEQGKQTPSKEHRQKLADYFGVSIAYLKGETNDITRQDSWMDIAHAADEQADVEEYVPKQKKPKKEPEGSMADALVLSPSVQELLRKLVREELTGEQSRETISRIVREELKKDLR